MTITSLGINGVSITFNDIYVTTESTQTYVSVLSLHNAALETVHM